MSKRKRDYAAEYKRRIARGKKQGLSTAVARGHRAKGTANAEQARFLGIRRGEKLKPINAKDFERWQELRKFVASDARRTFGSKPKRGSEGDEDYAAEYELRLQELAAERGERDSLFDWTDEAHFVAQMQALGATERQAYTFWFSP